MIKKILDYVFSRGQPPITEETVEEYLAGKEIKPKKPKIPKLAAALLLFIVASAVLFLTVFKKSEEVPKKGPKVIRPMQNLALKQKPKPKKTEQKKKTEAKKEEAEKKKPIPEPKKAEAEAPSEEESANLTVALRNPFDISEVSTEIESLQVQSKILEKKVELMKRRAELLEVQKKIKELEKELEETSKSKTESVSAKKEEKKQQPSFQAASETEETLSSLFEEPKAAPSDSAIEEEASLKEIFSALEESVKEGEREDENESSPVELIKPSLEEKAQPDRDDSILLGKALAVAFSVLSADLDRGCITLLSGREICSGKPVAVSPILLEFDRLYFTDKGQLVLEFRSRDGKKFLVKKDVS